MPTFDDPRADASEASAALRGLAHATRTMPEPAATYPVRGYTDLAVFAVHPAALDAEPAPHAEAVPRWISVVFLDGSEADEVLDLITREGTNAAIEHLAGFDFGEETTQAALENGYVYDTPPTGKLDRTATSEAYTLTYNPFMGHVSLLREYDAPPVLTDVEPTAAKNRTAARPSARPSRAGAETDWFARTPASSAHGRGLVL